MINRGLSHYQRVQKSVTELENRAFLEKMMEKGALYNIAFLQNRALMEMILALPEEKIDAQRVAHLKKLLSWLCQTQEEARIS
ncbi:MULTISPECIES: hypothetical protein [unclassified Sulfurospirillum]|uniref:hypothetical protein n=1 Tax=unclassified Sulfurospirillum TaxID=2618290 RepID=UPI000504FD0C|nr:MULTISPECIES: hypothetical protein [unclassified Sulfurospirillum]KFL34003.1 hypothetical protein JU57_07755 [Sulfurospirillum sp. SCADC]